MSKVSWRATPTVLARAGRPPAGSSRFLAPYRKAGPMVAKAIAAREPRDYDADACSIEQARALLIDLDQVEQLPLTKLAKIAIRWRIANLRYAGPYRGRAHAKG